MVLTSNQKSISLHNAEAIPIAEIPVLAYADFKAQVLTWLHSEKCHCVAYYAYPIAGGLKFIAAIADDSNGSIDVLSHEQMGSGPFKLEAISATVMAMHIYEREIAENYGVVFIDHPWAKPVRFAFNRYNQDMQVNDYPFYKIESDQLHEVGVGPIHAGVIEPGHFRFLCNGETVLHLEIQLGWQHRGIEQLYLDKSSMLQRAILSENIAGDTAVGHTTAFSLLTESLVGTNTQNAMLDLERCIALEWERIAMCIFDLSNLNIGIAYQLANSVFGALRTPVINFFQSWCGNRFGKSLIRPGGTNYPLTDQLVEKMKALLDDFEVRFDAMAEKTFHLPSVLNRFDGIGKVTKKQMMLIGAVGQSAKMAGLVRDIRSTHPIMTYEALKVLPEMQSGGDVLARFTLRRLEIKQSITLIRNLLDMRQYLYQESTAPLKQQEYKMKPNMFSLALIEGWRGEICHSAVTDGEGNLKHYKVKDPSFHNWLALALSLRNLEISDFPINNKSYNLSYCGFDL
ncbi:NADH dehydrogenase subunit [Haliscomenobacter sp.]|uniref:hydrogenase large subunit n=1 Tax=Haliscomenobacter sp. TaxID=2717303 RepID=UPI00336511DA